MTQKEKEYKPGFVGLDGAEREVCSRDGKLSKKVEQSGFTHIGKTHNTNLQVGRRTTCCSKTTKKKLLKKELYTFQQQKKTVNNKPRGILLGTSVASVFGGIYNQYTRSEGSPSTHTTHTKKTQKQSISQIKKK